MSKKHQWFLLIYIAIFDSQILHHRNISILNKNLSVNTNKK